MGEMFFVFFSSHEPYFQMTLAHYKHVPCITHSTVCWFFFLFVCFVSFFLKELYLPLICYVFDDILFTFNIQFNGNLLLLSKQLSFTALYIFH